MGFGHENHASEDRSRGPTRFVRHLYIGDKFEVREFYRAQVPLVRWTPSSENQLGGRHVLRFKRQWESCTIRVADGAALWTRIVEIEVLIAPRHE